MGIMNADNPNKKQITFYWCWWKRLSIFKKIIFFAVVGFVIFKLTECRPGMKIYGFTMNGVKGDTVFDFALARLIFEGVPFKGESDGGITINGWGGGDFNVGESHVTFSCFSKRGVTTVSYAGFHWALKDNGTILEFGTNVIRLEGKPTILLKRDGTAKISQ